MALQIIQSNAYEVTPVLAVNAQTGTSYTPTLGDSVNTLVTLNNAGAITLTIPPNSTTAFPVGTILNFVATGAGQVTFAAGAGVTIVSTGGTAAAPKIRVQYSSAAAIQTSANTWLVIGDIS